MTTFSPTSTGRSGSTQDFTTPSTGSYGITAVGSKGGDTGSQTGGSGTSMYGEFSLTAGDVIRFMVGQEGIGISGQLRGGGGGGATFVYNFTTSTLLLVAGGGGGTGQYSGGTLKHANITSNGSAGSLGASGNGAGGTAPNGGGAGTYAAGGGGYSGNGASASAAGGLSYTNGGTGGSGAGADGKEGGYGGGGGSFAGAGGGGGYGGGGGGGWHFGGDGGGGGSYNGGTNQTNTAQAGTGVGSASVVALNAPPNAPTWSAPADNSYNDINSSLLLDWTFTDPDAGDTQSAYALSKSVDGGALSYWNAGTSAWVGAEVENPTATTSVTLASSWASDGESIEYKVKTLDAAGAAGPYGSGLTVNGAAATPPTITAPATSAVLGSSSATVEWTVAAQAAYQVRVLSSVDAELFTTGKITGAVTEVTLGYVFTDGQTGLKIELTTWNASDVPGVDTSTGISVSFTPPATPVLTITANAAGYISVAIADPTPTGSEPTVVTHNVYVRVASGGTASGERPVVGDGIRIATGVATNGTYLDYAAASGTDFEYRTMAIAFHTTPASGGATSYSAWTA